MSSESAPKPASPVLLWFGRVLSTLPVLMLLMSAGMKLSQSPQVVKGFADFGFPAGVLVPLGVVELISTILYAVPFTSMLGAILLTGYLGGAIATHVHANDGSWPFPIVLGVLLWLGLALRDPRLWQLIPVRSRPKSR